MRERGFPGSLVEANRAGMIAATLNWEEFTRRPRPGLERDFPAAGRNNEEK